MEELDLAKEQRRERLGWVFLGVTAMLIVVCLFYMQMVAAERVVHACAATILTYGALAYVEEFDYFNKAWLWKGIVTTIPLHIGFVGILLWWDGKESRLAQTGYMFVKALALVFAVEMVVFTGIVDRFKVSESPDHRPGKLKRFLTFPHKPKGEKVITLAEEDEDDIDPTKQSRKDHLRWGFWGVSTVLLASYFFKGFLISSPWLHIVKACLLTMLCYGHFLYVEEKDEVRSRWLWVAVLATLPFHVAFLGVILAIDRAVPYLAPNPIAFLFIIWAVAWIESRLMDQIAEDYRPWAVPLESAE
jgi:hypothetical protein